MLALLHMIFEDGTIELRTVHPKLFETLRKIQVFHVTTPSVQEESSST